jgi:hypothetical protein
MIDGRTELHQRRFYIASVLVVFAILRPNGNLPENGMDEVCVDVLFVQRGPDCELDARDYVSIGSIGRPRTGRCFLDLHVAPHAGVYPTVRNSSNGRALPIPFLGELADPASGRQIAF